MYLFHVMLIHKSYVKAQIEYNVLVESYLMLAAKLL